MSRRLTSLTAMLGLAFAVCLAVPGCGGSSKVTRVNGDKVTTGMSEDEVIKILGPPTESAAVQLPGFELPGMDVKLDHKAKQAIWRDGGRVITISFVNGKVAAKVFADGGEAGASGNKPVTLPGPLDQPPFVQTGKFDVVPAEEGVVNFPLPYALPPNVEINEFPNSGNAVVKDVTATGFKWKGVGTQKGVQANWTARGVRANKLPESK